ncbi:aminotransferase class I/II-fold pyridoxal phosphate-dependent enzyme [bacterium SCSIO 12741]|nr:aminotransferase class I/II-fold pyridoxal phosphate-dependent enzyme [bacterium SCSIO 12741]
MTIDLRSDTVTHPTPGMLDAMVQAKVGDDVFGEDPTVIELEQFAASLFNKEAGLFFPSGTFANQVAIQVHTRPGDSVICDHNAHVYRYEGGGMSANSGVSPILLEGDRGRLSADQVKAALPPDDPHFSKVKLVCLENTSNKGGGSIYRLESIREIRTLCIDNRMALHLDGARVFNALIAKKSNPRELGRYFDSLSVCLSKGLGAPVGSLLLGDQEFIYEAKRVRKRMGGGMRQAGFLAAAGLFAMNNQVDRLADDHRRARQLADMLKDQSYVQEVLPVETNIVIYRLDDAMDVNEYIQLLDSHGLKVVPFGPGLVRMVTHLDFTDTMLAEIPSRLSI